MTSVPTVKNFRNGQVAHTIHGAESGSVFRKALERFIASDTELVRMLLVEAALDDPENPRIPAGSG